MRSWCISWLIGLGICLGLISISITKLMRPDAVRLSWLWVLGLLLSALAGLFQLAREIRQVAGRGVLLNTSETVNPLDGRLTLENISGPCQIALFLNGGLTRLHGQVHTTVRWRAGSHEAVTELRRLRMSYLFGNWISKRFPFFRVEVWDRAAGRDYAPLIIKIPVHGLLSSITVEWHFASTFAESKLAKCYPVHAEERLRCVVSRM